MAICKDSSGRLTTVPGATCPQGYTQVGGTGAAAGTGTAPAAGTGTTTVKPSFGPPDKDSIVWAPTYESYVPGYTPGGGPYTGNPVQSNKHTWQTKTQANTAGYFMSDEDRAILMGIAKANGGRSINPVLESFVGLAAAYGARGERKSPMDLAREYAKKNGIKPVAIGPGGGGPGSSGSGAEAPTPADASGMKRMMDQLSMDKIGRTLSDAEFKRYYGSYTKSFAGNPDMDPTQHGTEALQGSDDYQEYQVATKFAGAMQSILRGAS